MNEKEMERQSVHEKGDDVIAYARAMLGKDMYRRLVARIRHPSRSARPRVRTVGGRDIETGRMARLRYTVGEANEMISQKDVLSPSYRRFELEAPSELTPEYLDLHLAPYLAAMGALQRVFNDMGKETAHRPAEEVIVRLISYQSPYDVALDGVAEVVNSIKEDIVPWRRNHAKAMAELKELELQTEIKKREAEIKEVRARSVKDRAEARKLDAEVLKMRAEAESQMLENERKRFEIEQSKLTMAIELVTKMHPELDEGQRILHAVRMLPAITTLALSDIEFKKTKMLE